MTSHSEGDYDGEAPIEVRDTMMAGELLGAITGQTDGNIVDIFQKNTLFQETPPDVPAGHDCTKCVIDVTRCALLELAQRSEKARNRMKAVSDLNLERPGIMDDQNAMTFLQNKINFIETSDDSVQEAKPADIPPHPTVTPFSEPVLTSRTSVEVQAVQQPVIEKQADVPIPIVEEPMTKNEPQIEREQPVTVVPLQNEVFRSSKRSIPLVHDVVVTVPPAQEVLVQQPVDEPTSVPAQEVASQQLASERVIPSHIAEMMRKQAMKAQEGIRPLEKVADKPSPRPVAVESPRTVPLPEEPAVVHESGSRQTELKHDKSAPPAEPLKSFDSVLYAPPMAVHSTGKNIFPPHYEIPQQ